MSVVRSLAASSLRRLGWMAALVSAFGLVACGGSTSRSEPYVPARIVVFGDDLSTVETNGGTASNNGVKYSINAFNSTNTTTPDCNVAPVWPQYVVQAYGMVFSQCNTSSVASPTAFMLATAGATVNQVIAQIDTYTAANGPGPSTLYTVMAGQNDVLVAMDDYINNRATADDVKARMITLANALGDKINQVTNQGNGPRVLFALLPNLYYSPYGASLSAANRDLLRELIDGDSTTSKSYVGFNGALRLRVTNNGRWAGMVVTEQYFNFYVRTDLTGTGLTNNTSAACTVALPNCTINTLDPAAANSTSTYLWADATRFGPVGHSAIGNEAVRQVRQGAF